MDMPRSHEISFDNRDKYIEMGFNISYYRKLAGLKQEELAEKAGISRVYLSSIEAPNIIKPCSLEVLFNIAKALEIEPYKLIKFREE